MAGGVQVGLDEITYDMQPASASMWFKAAACELSCLVREPGAPDPISRRPSRAFHPQPAVSLSFSQADVCSAHYRGTHKAARIWTVPAERQGMMAPSLWLVLSDVRMSPEQQRCTSSTACSWHTVWL